LNTPRGERLAGRKGKLGVARQTVSAFRPPSIPVGRIYGKHRATDFAALLPKALNVLERAIDEGGVNAAVAVLKAAGLHGLQPPEGPTTAEDAESGPQEQERAHHNRALFASLD
jgi:hypothetical protein